MARILQKAIPEFFQPKEIHFTVGSNSYQIRKEAGGK